MSRANITGGLISASVDDVEKMRAGRSLRYVRIIGPIAIAWDDPAGGSSADQRLDGTKGKDSPGVELSEYFYVLDTVDILHRA